jgi:hypothetical protein
MVLVRAFEQAESRAELGARTIGTVPHDLQTAASGWPLGSEARHDDVAAGAHDTLHLRHIPGTISRVREEVKYCSVVPDVIECGWERRVEDVCNDPLT